MKKKPPIRHRVVKKLAKVPILKPILAPILPPEPEPEPLPPAPLEPIKPVSFESPPRGPAPFYNMRIDAAPAPKESTRSAFGWLMVAALILGGIMYWSATHQVKPIPEPSPVPWVSPSPEPTIEPTAVPTASETPAPIPTSTAKPRPHHRKPLPHHGAAFTCKGGAPVGKERCN